MKKLQLILFFTAFLNAKALHAQHKIVLKNGTTLENADYHKHTSSVVEYLQSGSLHDVAIENVLWLERDNAIRWNFNENGELVCNSVPQILIDSSARVKYKIPNNPKPIETSVQKKAPIWPQRFAREDSARRLRRSFEYAVAYRHGKIFRSRVGSNAANYVHTGVATKYGASEYVDIDPRYRLGFLEGIRKKEKQRVAAIVAPLAGILGGLLLITAVSNQQY